MWEEFPPISTAEWEATRRFAARTGSNVRARSRYVLLAVTETGCGMTPEVQARIFVRL